MYRMKYAVWAVILGILFGIAHTVNTQSILLSDVFLKLSFSEYILTPNNASYYDKLILCFFPSIIFQVISGTEVYRHFCTGAVYYFSRCTNRKKWYIKEISNLYLISLLYFIFFAFSFTIVFEVLYTIKYDGIVSIYLCFYYLVIFSLWNYIFSLLLNIIAFFLKSSGGFIVSFGVQLLFISFYVIFQEKLYKIYDGDIDAVKILKAIPFSNLIISWHSSANENINSLINIYNINFDLNLSVVILVAVAVIVTLIGMIAVEKTDFIYSNKESGG